MVLKVMSMTFCVRSSQILLVWLLLHASIFPPTRAFDLLWRQRDDSDLHPLSRPAHSSWELLSLWWRSRRGFLAPAATGHLRHHHAPTESWAHPVISAVLPHGHRNPLEDLIGSFLGARRGDAGGFVKTQGSTKDGQLDLGRVLKEQLQRGHDSFMDGRLEPGGFSEDRLDPGSATEIQQGTDSFTDGRQDHGSYIKGPDDLGHFLQGEQDLGSFDESQHDLGPLQEGQHDLGNLLEGQHDLGGLKEGRHNLGSLTEGGHDLDSFKTGRHDLGAFKETRFHLASFHDGRPDLGSFTPAVSDVDGDPSVQEEGGFMDDETDCGDIETRSCSTDDDCECNGFYSCLENSCQLLSGK